MSTLLRYLQNTIKSDLKEKMVFLGGPRQVGKTTFSQTLLKNYKDHHPAYLNWDDLNDRKIILSGLWPSSEKLIIFDEIHKFRNWRSLMKGLFDKFKNNTNHNDHDDDNNNTRIQTTIQPIRETSKSTLTVFNDTSILSSSSSSFLIFEYGGGFRQQVQLRGQTGLWFPVCQVSHIIFP